MRESLQFGDMQFAQMPMRLTKATKSIKSVEGFVFVSTFLDQEQGTDAKPTYSPETPR